MFQTKGWPQTSIFQQTWSCKRISNKIVRSNSPGAVSAQRCTQPKARFDCAPALWCQTLHVMGSRVPYVIYSLHAEAFLVKLLGERKVEFCLLPHPRLALLLCCRIIPVIDVWKEQFSGNKKYIPVLPELPGITGEAWSQAGFGTILGINRIMPTPARFGMHRNETHLTHQQFRLKGYTQACREVNL